MKVARFALLAASAATATAAAAAGPALGLTVRPDGSYAVTLDGVTWLASGGGAPAAAVAYDNVLRSTLDGSLKADGPPAAVSGSNYTGYTQSFNGNLFAIEWALFPALNSIVFTQSFPKGLTGMAVNGGSSKDLATAFPVFAFANTTEMAWLTWPETMCTGVTGLWTRASVKSSGLSSDGGTPLVLYNKSAATVVLSTSHGFMTGNVGLYPAVKDALGSGFNGMLQEVPAGWSHATILVAGQGVNDTVMSWGDLLLAQTGKHRTRPDADLIVSTLGYWTDNGAFYYYLAEAGKTMQQTILDVLAYWATLALPVKHLMYDSWWYWKECDGASPNTWLTCRGAVELWEPRTDCFPDGLSFKEPLPLALHNRYFSANNNTYANALGFASSFIIEKSVDLALPVKADVFTYMMAKAKAWGAVLYEQDWLVTVWRGMNATRSSVDASHNWLAAMAEAATALDLTIQYCMPLPRHMLESTHFQAVTNARASGDYHPGAGNFNVQLSSLFYWAIGVAPSKDDYWTTEVQTGSPYSDQPTEPNWQLQAIVVGLSTGPNGPSDKIGYTNASLVMSTVRGDGLNLQPDRPATLLDSALLYAFAGNGELPDVRSTWTAHADHALRWHNVLAVSLAAPFPLKATDLGPTGTAPAFAVFDWFNPTAALAVLPADGSKAFTIPTGQGQPSAPATAHSVQHLVLVPQLAGGWWLLGEAGKVVGMSHQRVDHVREVGTDGFSMDVLGSAGEPAGVTFLVAGPTDGGKLRGVTCPSVAGKVATLTCSAATNACTCA